jgi:TetR/AcrR family transcriptional repressor of nem operon
VETDVGRASREQAARNREEITRASARLFRERGLNGVSVAELTAAAGLTHGGFYGHFASKDALAAAACEAAFEESAARWRAAVASRGQDTRSAVAEIVERYLRAVNCEQPGASCPGAALAMDVAREPADALVRKSFAAGFETLVGILAPLVALPGSDGRREAMATLSTLVGALNLARAASDPAVAAEIMDAAKAAVLGALPA